MEYDERQWKRQQQRRQRQRQRQQPIATMMLGYLYMVGSEEMAIQVDYAKAEQVRAKGEPEINVVMILGGYYI